MADAPRLAPGNEADWDDDTARLVEGLGGLNIFRTLARHPDLFRAWLRFGSHVLMASTLDARTRELLILRVGWRCGSEYEFGQHTVIGRQAGLTDDEIRLVTLGPGADGWSDADRDLLVAADELIAGHTLSDATWERLTARLDERQLLDLIFTVGQYVLVSMALRSCRVPLDPGVPGFPS